VNKVPVLGLNNELKSNSFQSECIPSKSRATKTEEKWVAIRKKLVQELGTRNL